MSEDPLNPLQQEVMDSLKIPDDWTPLPATVVTDVEAQLLEELADLSDWFTAEQPLRVSKHLLTTIHGCEAHHMAQRAEAFSWNINTVRGTMVHKAVELLLNWKSEQLPSHIVDAAITSVINNPRESASDFVASLSEPELAELRGAVVGSLTNFLECFPPLKPQWRPVVEHSARYAIHHDSIVFTARMDLVIGLPGRKVIIDLKTGRITATHRDDLRFYALLDTLRSRQPPRRLATYSLDAARLDTEDVSEGALQAAVRRTSHGVRAMAELVTKKREPLKRTGMQCKWCPLLDTCEEGAQFVRQLSGIDDDNL